MSASTSDKNIEIVCEALVLNGVISKILSKNMKIPLIILKRFKELKNMNIPDITDGIMFMDPSYILHSDFKNRNGPLYYAINEKFRSFKKQSKYISSDFDKKETMIISFDEEKLTGAELNKDFLSMFKYFITQKNNAPCFTWNHNIKDIQWCDKDDLYDEFKRFKKLLKNGTISVDPENNHTHKLDKVDWYCIVINSDNTDVDVASIKLFDFYVSGFVYWFNNKKNRDAMFEYLIK